jgi:hypothetical protein
VASPIRKLVDFVGTIETLGRTKFIEATTGHFELKRFLVELRDRGLAPNIGKDEQASVVWIVPGQSALSRWM